jgi:hypothetical protein
MATNNTLTLIQAVTVGAGGIASINFNAIPQTYTDLFIYWSPRSTSAGGSAGSYISFNNSTSNFLGRYLQGTGVGTFDSSGGSPSARYLGEMSGAGGTASTFSTYSIYINNYTSSNNKTVLVDSAQENNTTGAYISAISSIWSSSAAITTVDLSPSSGVLAEHTTAYLYGVASAAVGAKATGGNIISQDADYFYHIFTSSGTFTPTQSLTADYLVVAGGGGGGQDDGGGGGAGGLRCTVTATGGGGTLETPLSLTATAYAVTIGAGGSAGTSGSGVTNGSNSVFSTITSIGGGKGGGLRSVADYSGGNGGSGGGPRFSGSVGTGTTNQGFAGGASNNKGGGGGGAGVVGSASSSVAGGTGGNGVATIISGTPIYYAGGGGGGGDFGGTGGLGGGGKGGTGASNDKTSGGSNTGGGGGGGSGDSAGGFIGASGGSGIVIVRYAK